MRESRHDVLPASRLSARWCPVEEEFQGSNVLRIGSAGGGIVEWGVGILWGWSGGDSGAD